MSHGQDQQEAPEITAEQIRRRFAAWLDEVLAVEEPPPRIAREIWAALDVPSEAGAAGGGPSADPRDLHGLWSALTVLSQEVRLQGREFRRLTDRLAAGRGGGGDLDGEVGRLAAAVTAAHAEALRREGEERARGAVLEALLDVRDSLLRNRASCRAYLAADRPPGGRTACDRSNGLAAPVRWLGRALRLPGRAGLLDRWIGSRGEGAGAREAVAALEKGCSLGLDRLDELLGSLGVQEITCQEERFDPRRMIAVDLDETTPAEEGRVLEVYRRGYERNGAVLRPARVRVARAPRPGGAREAT